MEDWLLLWYLTVTSAVVLRVSSITLRSVSELLKSLPLSRGR